MAETLIMNAAVAVATVYENTARGSGKPFWNVVTDTKDRFTAFSRDIVAHLMDGRTPTVIPGRDGAPDSLAYNLKPPLNTMLFFEARATGKVLVQAPMQSEQEGAQPSLGTNVDKAFATAANLVTNPPAPPPYKPPYKPYGGGQKAGSGWKPKDERPSLVTMNEAYAKDIVTAIIGHSADIGLMAPEAVVLWATEQTLKLAKVLLDYSLTELQKLGFKLEPSEGGSK